MSYITVRGDEGADGAIEEADYVGPFATLEQAIAYGQEQMDAGKFCVAVKLENPTPITFDERVVQLFR